MKVLMQSRSNFYSLPGGDTIQLLKTKKELETLGVKVDLSLELEPDLAQYDIVHVSNLTRIQECYLQVKNAISQNKPIVLSTIYWPMDEFEKNGQVGIRKGINKLLSIDAEEKIKAFARYIVDKEATNAATVNLWKKGYTYMQKYVIDNVDFFLPNSQMEMDALVEKFGLKGVNNYIIVPNAIDDDVAKSQWRKETRDDFLKYKDAVICVGRIEPRKNQLALVKALAKTDYKLVLVGAVSRNQKKYYKQIKKYIDSNPNFYHLRHLENDDLYNLYKVCRVSVLPSWLDTPGLVNLEAGAMGCNLVVSSKGSTKEYFRDLVEYCLPDDLEGIRNSVDKAYSKDKQTELQNIIFAKYTWKEAAKQTLLGYESVLGISGTKGLTHNFN